MFARYRFYILPALLVILMAAEHFGVLHVGYLYIKSHELRWTNLDYNYHPRQGDVFTAGESVYHNNYEDAVLAINPDYTVLLQKDLDEIAENRDHIDSIDRQQVSFFSGDYMVKVCLDKKDISIKDSTFFKKLVNVEILGQYELYDKDGCELLFQQEGKKFWIRDKIIMRGLSRRNFIFNKIEEIWLAQMSNNAHQIITYFERPYIYREKLDMITTLKIYSGRVKFDDINMVKQSARKTLFEFDRAEWNGSRVYGHMDDPKYKSKVLRHIQSD